MISRFEFENLLNKFLFLSDTYLISFIKNISNSICFCKSSLLTRMIKEPFSPFNFSLHQLKYLWSEFAFFIPYRSWNFIRLTIYQPCYSYRRKKFPDFYKLFQEKSSQLCSGHAEGKANVIPLKNVNNSFNELWITCKSNNLQMWPTNMKVWKLTFFSKGLYATSTSKFLCPGCIPFFLSLILVFLHTISFI